MDKSTSLVALIIWIIIAVAAISIFTVLFFADQTGMLRGKVGLLSDTVTYSPQQNIASIDVDWISGDIAFTQSSDDQIHVTYHASSQNVIPTISNQNGILTIQDSRSGNFFFVFGWLKRASVSVALPQQQFERIRIKGVSSDITATNLQAQEIDLSSVSGKITVQDVQASRTVSAQTVSGSIRLTGTCPNLSAKTTSGSIEVVGAIQNKLEMATTSGRLTYLPGASSGVVPTDLYAKSISGSVHMTLPTDVSGFSLDYSKVSGSLNSDFPLAMNGSGHIYGDGSMRITVKTTSGSTHIYKG